MRIILAEDSALLRESLVALFTQFGHDLIAVVDDAPGLLHAVETAAANDQLPDLVITDVRMPPGNENDGLHAALDLRRRHPKLAVLVLSQFVADVYARRLLESAGAGVGYLLKDRVGRIDSFLNTLETIASGGIVIDPEVIHRLMARQDGHLTLLSPRELEVLSAMADGDTNAEIANRLSVTEAAVSKHIGNIFIKLDLDPTVGNRRVRAVLAYLSR